MTKSARTRASLIPYPVIAAAVGGDPEAVSRVVRCPLPAKIDRKKVKKTE